MYPLEDTITAVASARKTGGMRGIVRLSGPKSREALRLFEADPETLMFGQECETEIEIEENVRLSARIYTWREGQSYTGQQAVEIHTLGVLPFLDEMVNRLCTVPGVRLAQPGEFTLRAFLSGRLDLTQAEAVLGVIDASDPKRLDTALRQLAGGLALPFHRLRDTLFELLGHLEAGFDFADEDIEFISSEEIAARLAGAETELHDILARMTGRGGAETLPKVVLYGKPNVGKSRLFNALLERENAALVFDCPGTTRDYVTAPLSLSENLRCLLVDTAGDLRTDFEEFVPQKSQELAREQTEIADVRIWCRDALDVENAQNAQNVCIPEDPNTLVVLTRCDLRDPASIPERDDPESPFLYTSSQTGFGLKHLKTRIAAILEQNSGGESDVVAATQVRCRESLRKSYECISRARELAGTPFQELIAAEVRAALDQLGLIVGSIYTEDLLDSIFSRFCVGK